MGLEVERAVDSQSGPLRFRLGREAEAAGRVVEPSADGQRGRRRDDRRVREQGARKDRVDVDGRAQQRVAVVFALDERDVRFCDLRIEHRTEIGVERLRGLARACFARCRRRPGFDLVLAQHPGCVDNRTARGHERLGHRTFVRRHTGRSICGQLGDHRVDPVGLESQRVNRLAPAADPLHLGREPPEPPTVHVGTERVGDDVFDEMGFVDDDCVVLGKYLAARREVRGVEARIDDNDVGRARPGPCPLREAPLAGVAVAHPGAFARRDRHGLPDVVGNVDGQFGPVAGVGLLRPLRDARQRIAARLLPLGEGQQRLRLGPGGEIVELRRAQIVGPALQQRERELDPRRALQERKVFVAQLLLQCLGRSRHHDRRRLFAGIARRVQRGRDAVCERLARAGGRFDQEMLTGFERTGHRGTHLPLPGTLFTSRLGRDRGIERGQRRLRIRQRRGIGHLRKSTKRPRQFPGSHGPAVSSAPSRRATRADR